MFVVCNKNCTVQQCSNILHNTRRGLRSLELFLVSLCWDVQTKQTSSVFYVGNLTWRQLRCCWQITRSFHASVFAVNYIFISASIIFIDLHIKALSASFFFSIIHIHIWTLKDNEGTCVSLLTCMHTLITLVLCLSLGLPRAVSLRLLYTRYFSQLFLHSNTFFVSLTQRNTPHSRHKTKTHAYLHTQTHTHTHTYSMLIT